MDAINLNNEIDSSSFVQSKMNSIENFQKSIVNKTNLSDAEKAEYEKVARGFESIFINMMLKEMKLGMLDEEESDEGFGSDVLQGYTDLLLSDEMANSGKGIGVADMIYSQLTGGDKLKSITKVAINDAIESNIQNTQTNSSTQSTISPESRIAGNNFIERISIRLSNYDEIIKEASGQYNVPESMIKAVISAESAGKTNALSSVGAKGLMQLMDSTADSLGVKNSFDAEQNIKGGTKYLGMMLSQFDGNVEHALAAYNAGPGNVEKYNGVPPFKETQNYVARVKNYIKLFSAETENEL